MSKLKLGLASVAIAGMVVGGMPYITKNSIDTVITEKQSELLNKGLSLEVTKHQGYFDSQREIKIKFTDTVKILDFISKAIRLDIESVRDLTNNGMIFEDVSFKGTVKNSNLLPANVKAQITLDEIPENLKEAMNKNEDLKKFINALLLNVEFDTSGNIIFVSMNDLIIQNKDVVAKMIKPEVKIDKNIYDTSIQNMTFNISKNREYLLIYLDDIKDKIRYDDELNFDDKLTISQLKFNFKEKRRRTQNIKFESSDNSIFTQMKTANNKLDVKVQYDLNDILLNVQNTSTNIEQFGLGFTFKDVKEEPLRLLNETLSDEYKLSRILEPSLQEIVNNGLSMNINSKIKNVKNNNISAKEVAIDLSFTLDKNDIDKYRGIDYILKYLSVNGKISLDNTTVENLSRTLPIAKYNTNIKKDVSLFDIKFENNHLYINGQKI